MNEINVRLEYKFLLQLLHDRLVVIESEICERIYNVIDFEGKTTREYVFCEVTSSVKKLQKFIEDQLEQIKQLENTIEGVPRKGSGNE